MLNDDEEIEVILNLIASNNYENVLKKLTPLVEKNIPKAVGLMGFIYQEGVGVERDGLKAIKYLKQAIKLGDGAAAHNLGTLYLTDLPGVPKDAQLSKYYYRKAKAMGAQFADDKWYE